MPRIINMRPRALVAAVAATLAAASCTVGAAHDGSPSNSTTANRVTNPFKMVDRYPASSLGLHHPLGLTIGPHGNLYVTDAAQSVTVVSPDGKVLDHWGNRGSRRGDFDFVRDPNGNLTAYIAVDTN